MNAEFDRAAAGAFQRSLLPAALPVIPGLRAFSWYAPADGAVGGDWYDLFRLPSSETCAVIGDVAGSGLRAATVMGRARSAVRSYALETSDPADILSRVERKFSHFEPTVLFTALCAVFSPSLDSVRISSAGHLPPLMARLGGRVRPVETAPDLLIGVTGIKPRRVTTEGFPAGSMLCLYTDGLVERPDCPIDESIARLCAAVACDNPQDVCASAMMTIADATSPPDDVALLVISRPAR